MVKKVRRWLVDHLPAGVRLILVGQRMRRSGELEAALLPDLVAHGSTVIDVGAHTGHYSYLLAKLVGKSGRVISVEPFLENAKVLEAAARQLHLPIQVVVAALSSQEGKSKFFIPIEFNQLVSGLASLEPRLGEVEEREVPTLRLDQLAESIDGPLSFIKVDAEGHEYEILMGARETLLKFRPNLLVEIEERHSPRPITDTFGLMASLGYTGHFIDEAGELHPLSSFEVTTHQRAHQHNVSSKAYINNFVFTPT